MHPLALAVSYKSSITTNSFERKEHLKLDLSASGRLSKLKCKALARTSIVRVFCRGIISYLQSKRSSRDSRTLRCLIHTATVPNLTIHRAIVIQVSLPTMPEVYPPRHGTSHPLPSTHSKSGHRVTFLSHPQEM